LSVRIIGPGNRRKQKPQKCENSRSTAEQRDVLKVGYTIYGLGQFGDVQVNMKSPPFLVTRYPFSPGPPIQQSSASLARLGRTVASPARVAALKKPWISKPDAQLHHR